MNPRYTLTRREFLAGFFGLLLTSTLARGENAESKPDPESAPDAEPIIDIHQHTPYSGRTEEQMIAHQRKMGITHTILLPSGRSISTPTTLDGVANGLQAGAGSNDDA